MAGRRTTTNARRWFARAIAVLCVSFSPPAYAAQAEGVAEAANREGGYRFVCDDDGTGLSVVDVLTASGDHETFLRLFRTHDPEGFAILADPELSDKTVWAPTDAAFSSISDTLSSLPDDRVTAVLGYHITPPRRTPEGPYPIITPRFLTEGGEVVHQTRTGILTGSDQRVRTRTLEGVLTVEGSPILPTSWCTQTGSVFSISMVIMDARAASPVEQAIYVVFFEYRYLSLFGLGVVIAGVLLYLRSRTRGPIAYQRNDP